MPNNQLIIDPGKIDDMKREIDSLKFMVRELEYRLKKSNQVKDKDKKTHARAEKVLIDKIDEQKKVIGEKEKLVIDLRATIQDKVNSINNLTAEVEEEKAWHIADIEHGKFFGEPVEYWLRLKAQADFDMSDAYIREILLLRSDNIAMAERIRKLEGERQMPKSVFYDNGVPK